MRPHLLIAIAISLIFFDCAYAERVIYGHSANAMAGTHVSWSDIWVRNVSAVSQTVKVEATLTNGTAVLATAACTGVAGSGSPTHSATCGKNCSLTNLNTVSLTAGGMAHFFSCVEHADLDTIMEAKITVTENSGAIQAGGNLITNIPSNAWYALGRVVNYQFNNGKPF